MFQQRQINDVYQLIEVSFAPTVNPGAITTGSRSVASVTCVLNSATGTALASFIPGDILEVIPPASAGSLAGLIIQAFPSGLGTAVIGFYNASAGTITPVSGTYTIIAKRITPELL